MRLKYEAKNAWEFERENNKLEDVMNYSKGYMHFLDVGKTERTSAREIVRMAKENGYISIDEAMNNGKVNPGDKIYQVNGKVKARIKVPAAIENADAIAAAKAEPAVAEAIAGKTIAKEIYVKGKLVNIAVKG